MTIETCGIDADDQQGGMIRHRLHQRLHQHDVHHGVSSTTSRSQSSGWSLPRLNPPLFESTSRDIYRLGGRGDRELDPENETVG